MLNPKMFILIDFPFLILI